MEINGLFRPVLLMDKPLFMPPVKIAFDAAAIQVGAATLSNLNIDEALLYQLLKDGITKNRLEQEKIPQYYVEKQIHKSLGVCEPMKVIELI